MDNQEEISPPEIEEENQENTTEDVLAQKDAEIEELKQDLLRAYAETENVRKRGERERQDALKYGSSSFAKDVLDVADNLRRALETVPQEAKETDPALKALCDGVELTEQALLRVFERHGIRVINPHGEKFDYNAHQSMFEIESADHAPGTVAQVLQVGYQMHDRLLRPAMVSVAKGPAKRPDDKA